MKFGPRNFEFFIRSFLWHVSVVCVEKDLKKIHILFVQKKTFVLREFMQGNAFLHSYSAMTKGRGET